MRLRAVVADEGGDHVACGDWVGGDVGVSTVVEEAFADGDDAVGQ
jgi:hypothetical protein